MTVSLYCLKQMSVIKIIPEKERLILGGIAENLQKAKVEEVCEFVQY